MNLDYLGRADSRIHTVLYAVARRRYRGRLVIFLLLHVTRRIRGALLVGTCQPRRERDRERERERQRGGHFLISFLT